MLQALLEEKNLSFITKSEPNLQELRPGVAQHPPAPPAHLPKSGQFRSGFQGVEKPDQRQDRLWNPDSQTGSSGEQ